MKSFSYEIPDKKFLQDGDQLNSECGLPFEMVVYLCIKCTEMVTTIILNSFSSLYPRPSQDRKPLHPTS